VAAPEPEKGPSGPARQRRPTVKTARIEIARATVLDEIPLLVEADDPDGDALDIEVTWFVDGEDLMGVHGQTLPAGKATKGQVVRAKAVASDGERKDSLESNEITIANAPPEMITQVRDVVRLDAFLMRAKDPDDDPLTWRLEGAPAGLSIDKDGMLHYQGSTSEKGGAYTIRIVADDGDQGTATMEFKIDVSAGSDAMKAAKEAADAEAKKMGAAAGLPAGR
jgi:hypothetical protein